MPTITVDRKEFFARLGKEYSTKDFDELLFEYGLELDEDTTSDPNHPASEPHQLKIEVPANRYDLLCLEGIARALKHYLHPELGVPAYTLKPAPPGQERVVRVSAETAQIRPFFASAILRNVKFTPLSYASFIDLQDKLHANLARKRTLVAVGTHDLDKIAPGEISYEARRPEDIKFAPLNKTVEYDGPAMMALYKEDKHLSKYLHIIESSPVYPIIYDSSGQVLSMPPIINSDHTKITLDTTNIFIDVTATDETKLSYVIDVLVTMFSEYCAEQFTIEPVTVVYGESSPGGARTVITPNITPRPFVARVSYINSCTGLSLARPQAVELLRQMGQDAWEPVPGQEADFFAKALNAQKSTPISPEDLIHILVPPSRPDILHECDIMEDAAVAYGFNNLKRTFPATSTVAKPFPINKLGDVVRRLCAEAGWIEVLPLTLCSHDENYKFLNRADPGKEAVVLANPKTSEYQIIRTSLLPGILKTIRENRKHALPLKVFEVGDIVVQDAREERQARNVRRVAGIFCGRKAGFEMAHGLLDRLMLGLGVRNIGNKASKADSGYYIAASNDATYFPDRSAKVFYRPATNPTGVHTILAPVASADQANAAATAAAPEPGLIGKAKQALEAHGARDVEIGSLGILHPSVLGAYELDYPCSAVEFDLEPFLPAINYNEDTEFNAALRKHGIIPDLPKEEDRSPSPERPPSPSLSDASLSELDDLELDKDDNLPRELLEKYRANRMAEQTVRDKRQKFGRVYPIGKGDYTREVTEESKIDLEGEAQGSGTGVVCVLFKDYIPECKLLMPLLHQLAALYPSTKFVSIVSDHCIENYPDKNCPTMLVYRAGAMMGQIVGLGAMGGDKATLRDVERVLFAFRGIDFVLKVGYGTSAQHSSKHEAKSTVYEENKKGSDEDGDDSEDDARATGVGGGNRSGARRGIRSSRREESDDEFDL